MNHPHGNDQASHAAAATPAPDLNRSPASPHRPRFSVGARLALAASVLLALCAPSSLQAQIRNQQELVIRAEKYFAEDKLLEAEKLFLGALQSKARVDRRLCYERLVTIYTRLGRQDRTIQAALSYQNWLKQIPDPNRLQTLKIDLGLSYFALGHFAVSESYLREALAKPAGAPVLGPETRLVALLALAKATAQRGVPEKSDAAWKAVEQAAQAYLLGPNLSPQQQIQATWKLVESYRYQQKWDLALDKLQPLLEAHDKLKDPLGKRETLRKVADSHLAKKSFAQSEKVFREALDLHEQHEQDNRLTAGDLAADLMDVFERQKKMRAAAPWREQAAKDYRAVVDNPRLGNQKGASAVSAFWKLQRLLQAATLYRQALHLTKTQQETWAGAALMQPKLLSDRGTLELLMGSYSEARPVLRAAVKELESQDPPNLNELPRALNNSAIVELATDELAQAEMLGKKCLDLYGKYQLATDLTLVETFNLLGTCSAQQGEYAKAIEYFREGLVRCEKLERADSPRSKLLLNIALLHKSQGDMDEALIYCKKARAMFERFAEPDDLGFAAFDAAQANLNVAMEKASEAFALIDRILELCAKHKIEKGPLVVTARHCQALQALSKKQFAQAEKTWLGILALQEMEKQSLLLPRTLNYLGLCAELQDKHANAETLYRRARDLQQKNPRSFPVTHFITMWRLGELLDRKGQRNEARELLQEAVQLVEKTRVRTYGDSLQRATFLAQFAPAFDRLVEWNVRNGNPEAALAAANQGRSRTLLDQLNLAKVDPLEGVEGPDRAKWIARELDAKKRISALRAKAQMLSANDLEQDQAKTILAAFDEAQKDYVAVWREILNANPIYRTLEASPTDLIAKLRAKVIGPKSMMLVYYVGQDHSYLFLIGDASRKIEVFPLTVATPIALQMDIPEPLSLEVALAGARGILVKKKGDSTPVPLPALAKSGSKVPLNHHVARALVDHYRQEITDPDFQPTRGILVKSKDPTQALAAQRPDLLGETFLPADARRRIRESGVENLIVIPDGPLHKLPLEAMLLQTDPEPRYVLDELPPIVYAPSTAILALIADRPRNQRPAAFSLLTVGNPAYPQNKELVAKLDEKTRRSILGLQGQLPLLPGTADESQNIRKHFDAKQVIALEGDQATESKVVAGMTNRHFIHIAAHGFADDRFGNLFGAIALTPPTGQALPENDGFLSLHEIYRLPLKQCELAVLSACVTNVGPQQPLEAGVTLANGFLNAGARRVVASHWSVDDRSTADLMEAFFAQLTDAQQQQLPYAHALQRARQQIRAHPKWASPFHWAPFVLIGSGD